MGVVINTEVLMSQQNGPIRGRKTAFTWPFSLASLNKERQGNPASKTDWEPDFPVVIERLTVGPKNEIHKIRENDSFW